MSEKDHPSNGHLSLICKIPEKDNKKLRKPPNRENQIKKLIQIDLLPFNPCRILIISHQNIYIIKFDILYSTKKFVVREILILMGEDY